MMSPFCKIYFPLGQSALEMHQREKKTGVPSVCLPSFFPTSLFGMILFN